MMESGGNERMRMNVWRDVARARLCKVERSEGRDNAGRERRT